jgi:hypothetical protein
MDNEEIKEEVKSEEPKEEVKPEEVKVTAPDIIEPTDPFATDLPVAQAIENETDSDSDARKALRQVFRNYIAESPDKAEVQKSDLLKQLNLV